MTKRFRPLFLGLTVLMLSACATSEKVKLKDDDFQGLPWVIVNSVPFQEQTPALCGPTALYMVSKPLKSTLTLDEVLALTYTPGAKGTFKQDLVAGARRLGLAPYSVSSLHQIFSYLGEGTPVVIFHQTDFLWRNFWHFSVLTGYNRFKETFSVHIGPYPFHEMDISEVVKTWKRGEEWAYVVVSPENLPERAKFEDALANALAFLRLEFYEKAKDLGLQMQTRFPERAEPDIVLADAYSKLNAPEQAKKALESALRKDPKNAIWKKKLAEFKE